MNNFTVSAAQEPAQARARWFGTLVAVLAALLACACMLGIWYPFAREGIDSLANSVSLQASGVSTTGTVSETEKNPHDALPGTRYKLTVSFEVDGKTHMLKSSTYYKPIGRNWVGEPMPVIYHPKDPNIALIDTFEERWLEPINASLP